MLRKLKSFDIQSRRVLIRVDFNVPIDNDIVIDDYRIRETIPTIKHCLDQGAKVILISPACDRGHKIIKQASF